MFENNLKFCREELEMTQKELGHVFNVTDSTIRGWENSYDGIPLMKLIKFCNLYKFSVDFVLGLSRSNTKYKNDIKINKDIMGHKLRKLRSELNLTQQQIADNCSISRSTYSHYENSINLINTLTLYTLCKKYNRSIDKFLRND